VALVLAFPCTSASTQEPPGVADPDAIRRVPALRLPAVGRTYVDPAFGTRTRRVSGFAERACTSRGCPFEAPTYSQLQAFNADGSLMLLTYLDGYRVRRVSDLREVRHFGSAWGEIPRWHRRRRNILVHFDRSDDDDVTLQQTDVVRNRTQNLHTFHAYRTVLQDPSFEELSRDGRRLAGFAVRRDGRRELFLFDLVRRRTAFTLRLDRLCAPHPRYGLLDPDWLAPSPLGRYLVVQWQRDGTSRCSGLESYDGKTGRFAGRIVSGHSHGDLGVASGGREFFMTQSGHPDDPNMAGLAWYLLPGAERTAKPHYVRMLDWKAVATHVSCQGPPGMCLVTSSSNRAATCCGRGWQPFQQEVWLQYVTGGKRFNYAPVRRLAHHRSSEQGYWAKPHATLSRDGRYALFGSDWGIQPGRERVDPYLIELRLAP
jgi:hypothetical protein